eukprot:gnl/Chilomastix_cuspidata/46.p1 GENE.gnl/Chilomastix_cuspidata/46~~gnl/Chilomastix_cuspidata/46.p1  ORF type:complete len:268 (+),score=96.64 gnl/Chilomastix_cuspidata/46:70-804(+)
MSERTGENRSGFRRDERRGGRQRPDRRPMDKKDEWTPSTKLGRLVKSGRIKSIEEVFVCSMPIKEPEIIDHFLPELEEEVLKIQSVQKQTRAGQRTRFRCYAIVGDKRNHIGYGVGVASEVAVAIRKAMKIAKCNLIPVRQGYWGSTEGRPHTVPCKLSGKCGSVRVRLIPAPRGAGIVASMVVKKVLQFAGIDDVFTRQFGKTRTLMNSAHATFIALARSYEMLTPDLWPRTRLPVDIKAMEE